MFTMKAICSTTLLEMLLGGGGSKNHHHQQSRISKRRKSEEARWGKSESISVFYPSLLVFNISKLTPFYTIRHPHSDKFFCQISYAIKLVQLKLACGS